MAKEALDDTKKRARKIVQRLKKQYPDSKCSLDFKTTHQLMVATILSAQCTDDRVNQVTPALFKKYRSVKAFAAADLKELELDIYSTGFYSNKAKAIKNSAIDLVENHRGRIPKTLDELVKLPGVGRKTGSVILGAGCNLAEGIVVDTHVGRISRLLGWTTQKDAVKVERDLVALIPEKDWIGLSHMLIDHGRAVCIARRPKCADCVLAEFCPSARL